MALVVVVLGIAPGDGDQVSFIEAFWLSLMRTLDAGTMGGDTGVGFQTGHVYCHNRGCVRYQYADWCFNQRY